jgi:hypothetical protein
MSKKAVAIGLTMAVAEPRRIPFPFHGLSKTR